VLPGFKGRRSESVGSQRGWFGLRSRCEGGSRGEKNTRGETKNAIDSRTKSRLKCREHEGCYSKKTEGLSRGMIGGKRTFESARSSINHLEVKRGGRALKESTREKAVKKTEWCHAIERYPRSTRRGQCVRVGGGRSCWSRTRDQREGRVYLFR